jgi:tripeptidyl-peptidase-1
MVSLKKFLSLAAAAQAAFGSPLGARSAYSVKETHNVPTKWTTLGRAPADHKLHLKIGLKQGRFAELERHLYEGRTKPCLQSLCYQADH